MKCKENWEETKDHFTQWWSGKNNAPLLRVVGKQTDINNDLVAEKGILTPEDFHLNVEDIIIRYQNYMKSHVFLGDAFPSIDLNIGPGSMAAYLGCEPDFKWDTVWFEECIKDGFSKWGRLELNPENFWWKKHLEMIKHAQVLSDGDFLVNIPDILENVDILAAMRGPQNLCYDLVDEPDLIKECVKQVDDLYFQFFNPIYEIVKANDQSSSFTSFHIWGYGKTGKVQCDFSALMSPTQFREFVLPSLDWQCKLVDNSLYHLDGPDAIKHLDAVLEIKELNALQWSPGAGQPDAGDKIWYSIYDKIRKAGKSLWLIFENGDIDNWLNNADVIVKRYGSKGLYFLFPDMDEKNAREIIKTAERKWN